MHTTKPPAVIVIGAGPAGLTAAIALARLGIRTVVVERRTALAPFPRATGVNLRTMELMRAWGLESQLRSGAIDVSATGWIGPTLASPSGAEVSMSFPSPSEAAAVSPTTGIIAPQDHLEPVLIEHLRTLPTASIRFGTELIAMRSATDGVEVTLRAGDDTYTIRAEYVIGADGAHSSVRTQLGIRMEGPGELATYLAVRFRAPLMDVVGKRRHGLYMIKRPGPPWVFLPTDQRDRWTFSMTCDPAFEKSADYSTERLVELIREGAGVADLDVTIEWSGNFAFTAQLAERYRDGRAFLVGDAAHRMTPRGATGMNTAIHDGYDLGWKLAWVLRGWADAALLDTYETERRPVGQRNMRRSMVTSELRDVSLDYLDDIADRIPHGWLADGRTSTLDLIGDGMTLFAGPEATVAWIPSTGGRLDLRVVDRHAADVLGLGADGVLLVRPDGRVTGRWNASVDARQDFSGTDARRLLDPTIRPEHDLPAAA